MKNMISDKQTVPVPGRGKEFNGEKTLKRKKIIIIAVCILLATISCSTVLTGGPVEVEGTALKANRKAITSSCCIRDLGEKNILKKSEKAAEVVLKELANNDTLKGSIAKAPLEKTDNVDIQEARPDHEAGDENRQPELLASQKKKNGLEGDNEKVEAIEEATENNEMLESEEVSEEEKDFPQNPEQQNTHAEGDVENNDDTGVNDDANDDYLQTPVEGFTVSSPFGPRWGTLHTGIDLALAQGSPIYAADSGTVTFSGYGGGYGNMVKMDHGNGIQTNYAHCSQLLVSQGQQVERGETIALVGSTGNSTGPHLHFEVIVDGSCVDPAGYLDLK